ELRKRGVGLHGPTATETDASQPTQASTRDALPPTRTLDGFGTFGSPPITARPVPANYTGRAKADNPPGFYGPPEGLLAVNTLLPTDRLKPIDFSGLNARLQPYQQGEPADLRGPLFRAAFPLLIVDALVAFWLAVGP